MNLSLSRWWLPLAALWLGTGCVHTRGAKSPQEVRFDAVTIRADLELDKLNDEELFAAGSSAFAAEDYRQAARYFGRIADFHPESVHYRAAAYNAGLSHQKRREWEDAYMRFSALADAARGTGDALDATFRVAESLYHLERYPAAIELLDIVANRSDLPLSRRFEAQVQRGICELEAGQSDLAEKTLRQVLATYNGLPDKGQVDEYYPAQAQFFLGEIFRLHYEEVKLDPERSANKLAEDLEHKAQLLLSAQGHYLRAIRMGNGYWATAAGSQIGGLYENLYDHMVNAPTPRELDSEEAQVYRQEVRKRIRVLITKAITIYERTLEAAERIGTRSAFIERTRERLKKMKELLLAEAQADEGGETPLPADADPASPPGSASPTTGVPHS